MSVGSKIRKQRGKKQLCIELNVLILVVVVDVYSGLFALMISAACGCVTLGAVPLAPASGSARRCLFVCEFDPTDRSSLVRPIRQQTIAKTSVS